ncbi:MAG TPA: ADP-forming succinate--CoA ligase subunit beta [Nitrospiria bacterium]|nr:ADP-forming succinate--CoA ligase subunit beta [Nitrospiria bacterium]
MNIHEFQAKKLFSQYGIPHPKGSVAYTPEEAKEVADGLGGTVCVVKAQIHAGGRGKAGGVKVVKDKREVPAVAQSLLGKVLVTHQTGPQGREVKKLLVEEGVAIARELYLSLVADRGTGSVAVIASTEGGMEIEEVAAHSPDKILRLLIDPLLGYQPYQGRKIGFNLGLEKELVSQLTSMLAGLYRLFVEKGASLIEINPLVITGEKKLVALDAKVTFDDNALFRSDDVKAFRDLDEEDPLEIRASQYGLNYVKLDGRIGCMVNGAGLAMATMDVIKLAGSEPANFLDVGGGASKETVKQAFQILLSDKDVRGVFVNIFGGIVRCERIAGGIIDAAKEVQIGVPLVVRLEGTNATEAKEMLAKSGLSLAVADTLWDGAQKIVAEVG